MPPAYADVGYWECRFASAPRRFEWLTAGNEIIDQIKVFLGDQEIPKAGGGQRVLHIGAGSSHLSSKLCELFADSCDSGDVAVHNVDFSRQAVELGKTKSQAVSCVGSHESKEVKKVSSTWICMDLLSSDDILQLASCSGIQQQVQPYTLIIDKSTSDSIERRGCGDRFGAV